MRVQCDTSGSGYVDRGSPSGTSDVLLAGISIDGPRDFLFDGRRLGVGVSHLEAGSRPKLESGGRICHSFHDTTGLVG